MKINLIENLEILFMIIKKQSLKVLRRCRCMCRYPEPDEFKVDATYTCWVSYMKVGIHSKYTEHIHKFKYRQGNRPAGEHLRVALSITNLTLMATHTPLRTVNNWSKC